MDTIDGKSFTKNIKIIRESDIKLCRQDKSYKSIPESFYISLNKLDRRKYRAVVISTYMSMFWDGWKPKAKSKRIQNDKVMLTRRMLHQHFDIAESTAGDAIYDLVNNQFIRISRKHVYSGKQGMNLGTVYQLSWMGKSTEKKLHIYWGLLVSEPFLKLSVTLQAIIILLHSLHSRRKNFLTIRPSALSKFDVHRNRLPKYINQLIHAGLLEYIENHDYRFTWFDKDGNPNFYHLKLKYTHLSHTNPAPNSCHGAANATS